MAEIEILAMLLTYISMYVLLLWDVFYLVRLEADFTLTEANFT